MKEITAGLFIFLAVVFLVFLFLVLFIYIFYMIRSRKYFRKLDEFDKEIILDKYDDFKIKNPYNTVEGEYYKAQIHTHTTGSDGKVQPSELAKIYKEHGYSFLAITDHDKITEYNKLDDKTFVTIKGEEATCHRPFWPLPLGQHFLRIFVNKHFQCKDIQSMINRTITDGGVVVINHPSSISGLGTQCWDIEELTKLNNVFLIEISNHFSEGEKNIKYWHGLLKCFGLENPVWGIASDDTHTYNDINKEWIMVKAEKIDKISLYNALKQGAFYSTQGPTVDFDVVDKKIFVNLSHTARIKFINAYYHVVKEIEGEEAFYEPEGSEGFIRVELTDKITRKKAWSQPFWLVKRQ